MLKLLERTNAANMTMSAREQRRIQRWTGNNPYHLQIAAFRWWQMKQAGRVDFTDIWHFLCDQPAPPAKCEQSTDHRWPDWLTKPWQKLKHYWSVLDSFAGGLAGVALIIILIAMAVGLYTFPEGVCAAVGLLCP